VARTPEESLLDRPFVLIFAGMALGLVLDVDIPSIGAVAIVVLAALMTLALSPFGLEGLRRAIPEGILATLVSLGILSPAFTKSGTFTFRPDSSVAGFVAPVAVSPLIPNSVDRHTKEIVRFKPDIAVRISIDGLAEMHGHVRGSETAFEDGMKSLEILKGHGVKIARNLIGSYITSLEMAGCSFTLLKLDDDLTRLWDAPVKTAGLRWGM